MNIKYQLLLEAANLDSDNEISLINEIIEDNKISNYEDLLSYMKKNIKYRFSRKPSSKDIVISTPQMIKLGKGMCYEQSNFEAEVLKKLGYDFDMYFCVATDGTTDGATHTFVVVKNKGYVTWIENSWQSNQGIFDFKDINNLFEAIGDDWKDWNNGKFPILEFYHAKRIKRSHHH